MLIHYTTAQGALDSAPASRAPLVLGVNYSLLAISVTCVTLRIIVKAKLGKLMVEDALIVASTLITIAILIITTLMVPYGLGMHIADIHPDWWPTYSKYSYATTALACLPYPLTKLSMLFFYLALAPHPTFRKICYISILYMLASSTAMTLLTLFGCTPISGGWDHSVQLAAKCVNATGFYYTFYVANIATDVLVMVLPIPILLRLRLQRRVKLGLGAMFAVGIMIASISVFGVFAMYQANNTIDVLWDGAYCWMWVLAEFNAGIITACMPSMFLFINWVRGDINEGNKGLARPGTRNFGGPERYARGQSPREGSFRASQSLGSEEYIVMEMGGIIKPAEEVVMEVMVEIGTTGSRGSVIGRGSAGGFFVAID